jgi:acyl carrier protein
MAPDQALAALGGLLSTDTTQIGIAAVDWPTHQKLHGGRPFLNQLLPVNQKVEQPAQPKLERLGGIRLIRHLIDALAPILCIDAAIIDPSKPVTDFGLDSLMALELRNRIHNDFGVTIPTVRLLRGPSLEEIAVLLEAGMPEPRTLKSSSVIATPIEFPLSFGQQEWWFGHKIMPGSGSYNVGLTAKACPGLEWSAFERAMGKLMARHTALRTVFFESDTGIPMQRVLPSPAPDLILTDAGSWSDDEIREAILQDFQRPLALDQPMFRVCVFRQEEQDVLFFKFDHIIIDHWSVRICIEDLKKIYTAELAGSEAELEPLEAEYSEFVEWERKAVEGAQSEPLWEYWKEKLSGELPILRLPSSLRLPSTRQRPAVLISRGEALPLGFTPEHWLGVQRIAREYRATGYSVLLAVFQVLLYRYTGQNDVVVGTSVSGRENPKWTNMMGLFINLLALRGDLAGGPTFADYLVRTRDTVLEALEHQEFPFSLLVARLRQPRNLERIPIFQSFFNFLTDRSGTLRALFMGVQDSVVEFGASKLRPYMVLAQQEGRPEVGVQLAEIDGQLVGYLNYNRDILDPATAEAMAAGYFQLLDTIIRDPNTPIDDLLPAAPAETAEREKFVL